MTIVTSLISLHSFEPLNLSVRLVNRLLWGRIEVRLYCKSSSIAWVRYVPLGICRVIYHHKPALSCCWIFSGSSNGYEGYSNIAFFLFKIFDSTFTICLISDCNNYTACHNRCGSSGDHPLHVSPYSYYNLNRQEMLLVLPSFYFDGSPDSLADGANMDYPIVQ